jgi:hypothetical protein
VFARLTEEALCTGECVFVYDADSTPNITVPTDLLPVGTSFRRRLLVHDTLQEHTGFVHKRRSLWSEETKKEGVDHWRNHFHPRRNLQITAVPEVLKYLKYRTGTVVSIDGTYGSDFTNSLVYLGTT